MTVVHRSLTEIMQVWAEPEAAIDLPSPTLDPCFPAPGIKRTCR
jgi:hypothetical protein